MQNEIWGCFCVTLLISGLILDLSACFAFNSPDVFVLFEFSYQRILGLFLGQITYLGLVFQIYLLVFAK